jgi:hypothetical protein
MGNLMVSNIEKAVATFTEAEVHKRGYFKVKIETHPDIDWEQVSKDITLPGNN